jgi:glyoxylase-like metal-dependent hydrolase (beta-lactamase superfamily II)
MLQLKIFSFNPLQVNTYLIYEPGGIGIIIDPSCMDRKEFNELQNFIEKNGLRLEYQLNTHGHFDHVFGVQMVKDAYQPIFKIHQDDAGFLRLAGDHSRGFGFDFEGEIPEPDGYLDYSDIITAGTINLTVIHVPGHSKGSVAFYEASSGWLFSGDTLFAGGIGRTDLPGGNYDQIISSITEKLMVLPDATIVFPGHGPSSTVGKEQVSNPYL